MTKKIKLGIIIKVNRKKLSITQNELANKIKCDQSVISRIEIGSENVNIRIYQLALENLNLINENNEDNYKKINNLFNEIWTAFEFVDYKKITELEYKFNIFIKHNKDIVVFYEAKIFKLFFNYFKRKDVYHCLKDLNDFYIIYDEKFQILYNIIKLNSQLTYLKLDEAVETIYCLLNNKLYNNQKYQCFIDYNIGWYYFKRNNRSMALEYLLNSLEQFNINNNYVRIYRIEFIINNLLIREKNYKFAIIRYKEILNNFCKLIRPYDNYLVNFWIGYCYFLINDYKNSIFYFNQSLNVNDERADKNHVYYYLLMIYDKLDDIENYRNVLNLTSYEDQFSFGNKILNLYLQSRISHSSNKYYKYLETNIIPLITMHYHKIEISSFIIELLNYYYETQQYSKYHELSKKVFKFYA